MADYYTPKTLAALWGCSPDVVYTLLRARKLKGFKVGSIWRITDAARAEYEAAQEEEMKLDRADRADMRNWKIV